MLAYLAVELALSPFFFVVSIKDKSFPEAARNITVWMTVSDKKRWYPTILFALFWANSLLIRKFN